MAYNIDWNGFLQALIPRWMRKIRLYTWLELLLHPIRTLQAISQGTIEQHIYEMQLTGQTIYLEKGLNDRFDPIDRLIYIVNSIDLTQFYLYNKVEVQPPVYFYNKWDLSVTYAVGEFAAYDGQIWVCILASTGDAPILGSSYWSVHSEFKHYLINRNESGNLFDFIVMVPIALVYDENEMRALVNTYKLAGKSYTIQTY